MSYYFFLEEKMLPVPPSKMTVKVNNKNKTVNLINEGEVNIIKTPGLTEINFDVLLPNQYYPFANYSGIVNRVSSLLGQSPQIEKAKTFMEEFEKHKKSKKPARLVISRMTPSFDYLFDTNMLVTIEDYSIIEEHSAGLDQVVSLHLKQYRPYATKEFEEVTDENGNKKYVPKATRPTEKEVPAAYKIRDSQTIFEATKLASGGSLDWRSVATLNGISSPIATGIERMIKLV